MTTKNDEVKVEAPPKAAAKASADASPISMYTAQERELRSKAAEEAVTAEVPFDVRYHPDGTPRRMIISRANGAGEREITVDDWYNKPVYSRAEPGTWVIRVTEVVAPHHSDEY